MNLGENRIEMRIPRSAWVPRDLRVSRIPKPFLIEFITASSRTSENSVNRKFNFVEFTFYDVG